MEVFLIRLLQFMLAIGLLVLLHEGGHFFFSKLFGVRVEKFYLFFDVKLWKWNGKLFSHKPKKSDTEYGVGWLPLGGYCKISGMIDESFDTEQMKQPVQPWEFRSKPAWQRLLIMIGGVLVNFLLALFIYSMILFTWGETYVPVKDMSMGMKFNSEAKALGFKDGDILVSTDRGPLKKFDDDLFREVTKAKVVNVIRDGQPQQIAINTELNLLSMFKATPMFMRPFTPAIIDSVIPETAAAEIGLQKGDTLLAVNGKAIDSYNEFTDEIGRLSDVLTTATTPADSMKVRTISLVVKHADTFAPTIATDTAALTATNSQDSALQQQSDAQENILQQQSDSLVLALRQQPDTLQAVLSPELKLGFMPIQTYEPQTFKYGLLESIPAGIGYGWHKLSSYVSDMQYVFTAEGAKSLGGFGAIGSLFPETWDWHRFWEMTAFLSIILAFMNILPIPALDGGHVLFLLYEMITRRKPSEKFMIRAEYVGFGILILLMVVANLNDILRWLGYM